MSSPLRTLVSSCVVFAMHALVSSSVLFAQCANPWPTVLGSTGVEGTALDMLIYDPDGTGPLGERVLVAGAFEVAGSVMAQNLANYDPATRTWAPFGPGPYPVITAVARTSNGDLYVAGTFTSIAGVSANRVARWDGSNWSALGSGLGNYVIHLVEHPAGGIVASGTFTSAGGVAAAGIARWDGATWSAMGALAAGITTGVGAVAVMQNGDVCASVQNVGASYFTGVMRFDGVAWSTLGAAFPSAPYALLALPNGDLLAGGGSVPGGYELVARWNGTNWVAVPGAPFQLVQELAVLPNGGLAAVGRPGSSAQGRVAVWDGSVWTSIGDSWLGYSYGITGLGVLATGELIVSGDFTSIAGVAARSVALWDWSAWSPASLGLAVAMGWLAVLPDGSIFIGARYGAPGEGLVRRWNGGSWSPGGGGFSSGTGGGSNLTALVALPSGELVAGGQTGWSGPTPSPILQRWTGTSWSTMATATWGSIVAAVEMPNGDLVVAGSFQALSGVPAANVARYDGSSWSPLGAGLPSGSGQPYGAVALAVSPSGELLAATALSVFRWDGATWAQLGLSPGTCKALIIGADGAPIVAGNFTGTDVLRWDGVSWAPLGSGPGGAVQSLAILPDGDVVAGAFVDAGNPARPLQRWNGATWAPLGGVVDNTVFALANAHNGDLLLAGDFLVANGASRCRFARVSTSCPAGVYSLLPSCYGVPLGLSANVLPWLGGRCRTRASNLPPNSLALIAMGVAPASTPLASLLSVQTYGCQMLLVPDVLVVGLPAAGTLQAEFVIPDAPSLLGTSVRQQVFAIEFDAGGAVVGVRATNALVFQIGSF